MSSFESPTVGEDVYAKYGRHLVNQYISKHAPPSTGIPLPPSDIPLPSIPPPSIPPPSILPDSVDPTKEPVGILGAGSAGLYTALILDDLGIPFQIIEARGRVGGRLYTHTFPNQTGAPYNYFDVGAMRFPQNKSMNRVFHLFNYSPLNQGDLSLKSKLKPYYFDSVANNTLLSYNGVTVRQNEIAPGSDTFKSYSVIQDTDPAPYIAAGVNAIIDDVIGPFAEGLLKDLRDHTDVGMKHLMRFDRHSTRSYMTLVYIPSDHLNLPKTHLSVDVVNWLETFDKSTGWYDRAFTETVLEAVAFGWNPSSDPTPWFCIDGGAFQIADTMHQYLRKQQPQAFLFNKRVTSIKVNGKVGMSVTTDLYEEHRFSHVISTIPLPVMRTIELSEAGLSAMQANALRTLNYGPSIKIGMQFRTAWWTTANDKDGIPLNIIGGQTYTDSPLRTVVYPSFGDVMAGKTTTLIASYCWTEDAERLAALITSDKTILKEMVLRELARLHNVTIEFLRGQLIDTFAWSWSQDPCTMGAFAFFGPGKFGNLYTSLTLPAAGGRLHFASEAISVRHAWVEGALDSAWRAVYELLLKPEFQRYQDKFFLNWGVNAEWFSAPIPDKTEPKTGHQPNQGPDLDEFLKTSLLIPLILAANEPAV